MANVINVSMLEMMKWLLELSRPFFALHKTLILNFNEVGLWCHDTSVAPGLPLPFLNKILGAFYGIVSRGPFSSQRFPSAFDHSLWHASKSQFGKLVWPNKGWVLGLQPEVELTDTVPEISSYMKKYAFHKGKLASRFSLPLPSAVTKLQLLYATSKLNLSNARYFLKKLDTSGISCLFFITERRCVYIYPFRYK